MDKVEVTIPFYSPISFKRKRERTSKAALVRDVVRVSIPHLDPAEAPVAFHYELPPIDYRVVGDGLVTQVDNLEPVTLDNLDALIAQKELYERNTLRNVAYTLEMLLGANFANDYIFQSYGDKLPRLDAAPLDAVTIDANQRDDKAALIAEAAQSRLIFVGGQLYRHSTVPAVTVGIGDELYPHVSLELEPNWQDKGPTCFKFGLQNVDKYASFITQIRPDISLDKFVSALMLKPPVLPAAISAPDEVCGNAAYAVSLVLKASGAALHYMDAAAGETLERLFRLRARAVEGDREAPGLIAAVFSEFRDANFYLPTSYNLEASRISSIAKVGECAMQFSLSAPSLTIRPDDDPSLASL